MKKVAIVGTQGVPAKYGGFETLVENIIGENCAPGIEYTVFCSAKDYETKRAGYKRARLKYISLFHANGMQSIPYDILSMLHCVRGFDTVVVLGVSGGWFLPVFRLLYRKKLIVNIDGLEHKRAKWGRFAKWFLRTSEAMAVRAADIVIADNQCIQEYVALTYHKDSVLVAYGGDHAIRNVSETRQDEILEKMGVGRKEYAFSVCRIEPENNCHVVLEAFARGNHKLLFVGNWERSRYGQELKKRYGTYTNIRMLDSIYDLDILYTLRKNSRLYIHGHSAGGTNPSLVEAMSCGCPIAAFDVAYNRATTANHAHYFKNSPELAMLLEKGPIDGTPMRKLAEQLYTWKHIARQYEELY